MAVSMKDLELRDAVLREQSELLGASWARSWFERMLTEGRPVRGGWPGTLQEARFEVHTQCARTLHMRGLPPLSQDEIVAMANVMYGRAKQEWQQVARERQNTEMRKR